MDSKSISRKGVGVQVPASAPPHARGAGAAADDPSAAGAHALAQRALHGLAQDAFARAALPVLMHRINNATQVLAGLNTLLALRGNEALVEARTADLSEIAITYAESGWLLAVLGSALGAETLLERRERAGLAATLSLATELARRGGRVLECRGELPELEPRAGAGWEPAWVVGSWLHAACLSAASTATVSVQVERDGAGLAFVDDAPWDDARASLAAQILARVPEMSCEPQRLLLAPLWYV